MRKNRIQLCYRLILGILPLILILYILKQHPIYGSTVDWYSQHVTFADYFRKIFLDTGKLFPDFSLNLGGGQNFAQFTYYGLFRPDILISFFLPKIEMTDFIQIASIIYVILSVQLFYQWIKDKVKTHWIGFFVSCLFAFSAPLIFHSHRHIMFISYFPFLLLSLIGTDQYVKNKKWFWLVSGIFMMIICSYYFSVPGLFVIVIYGICSWLNNNLEQGWKSFFEFLFKFCGWMLVGVLLSGFYLIPTAMAIIAQARPALENPSLSELFVPKNGLVSMLYGNYSIGLSCIAIVSLIYGMVKRNISTRFLSFVLFLIVIIPLFQYVLGGMQYVRAKSLIPFIPLFLYLVGIMLEDWNDKGLKFPWYILIISGLQIFLIDGQKQQIIYIINLILIIILLISFYKRASYLLMIYLLVPIFLCVQINQKENYFSLDALQRANQITETSLVEKTLNENTGLYRFDDLTTSLNVNRVVDLRQYKTTQYSSNSNLDYNRFFYEVMKQPMLSRNLVVMPSGANPYFTSFMGVRYIYAYGEKGARYGYDIAYEDGEHKILENKDVLPMAYVSYDTIGSSQFQTLSYPYSMETIFMNTVVNDNIPTRNIKTSIEEIKPSFTISENSDKLHFESIDKGIYVKSSGENTIKLKLDNKLDKNKVLIIRFDVEDIVYEKTKDTEISINGIRNKKAATSSVYAAKKKDFEYVLGNQKGLRYLNLKFSDGEYSLKNIKFYTADITKLKERKENVSAMSITDNEDSVISGTVEAKEDGYFVTSIPYQKGLSIKIDGKEVESEKVNTAFLGAKITKGKHNIDIYYTLPGKELGKNVSVLSFLFIVLVIGKDKVKRKMKNGKCTNGK